MVRKDGNILPFPGTICLKTKQNTNKPRVLLLRKKGRLDFGRQLAASPLSPRVYFPHRKQIIIKQKSDYRTPLLKISQWLFTTIRRKSIVFVLSYNPYMIWPPTIL